MDTIEIELAKEALILEEEIATLEKSIDFKLSSYNKSQNINQLTDNLYQGSPSQTPKKINDTPLKALI